MLKINDFKKLEIRIGRVLSAEKVEGADRLLRLEISFGDEKRQIVSGIAEFYTPESLVGKEFPFVYNLESRTIMGHESQGMILAVDVDGQAILLGPDKEVPEGSLIR